MFKVYHSNSAELLQNIMFSTLNENIIKKNIKNIDLIIVENYYILNWLKINFKKNFLDLSSFNIILQKDFFYELTNFYFKNVKKINSLNYIKWEILKILPNIINSKELKTINEYLKQDINFKKKKQLINKITYLFQYYLLYNPEIFNSYLNKKFTKNININQIWQLYIWKKIYLSNKNINIDYNIYFNTLKILLNPTEKNMNKLPKNIFIYGCINLPLFFFKIFNKISKYIDVHLIILNPSCYFWWDNIYIKNENLQNNLLDFLGKNIKSTLTILDQIKDINNINIFLNIKKYTILNKIQNNILKYKNFFLKKKNKKIILDYLKNNTLTQTDNSITINQCINIKHEIEVLYKYILLNLKKNIFLPSEIIVMSPNINLYSLYISQIFYNSSFKIPFKILDQKIKNLNPIIFFFINILKLPYTKFDQEYLIKILSLKEISYKFKFYNESVNILIQWIIKNNINLNLYNNINYNKIFNNFIYKNINLGKNLKKFLKTLFKWKKFLSKSHYYLNWKFCIKNIIKDFFQINLSNKKILLVIINIWKEIILEINLANFNKKITLSILYDEFLLKLNNHCFNKKIFFNKYLYFCDLKSIFSVPFKIICLIGLNKHSNLDIYEDPYLLLKNKNYSYHNNDNTYNLFLESIIQAKKKIYISFTGDFINQIYNYNYLYIIKKFMYYITSILCNINKYTTCIKDIKNFLIQQKIFKIHKELNLDNSKFKKYNLISKYNLKNTILNKFKEKKTNIIYLNELKYFFLNPIKFWCKKILLIDSEIEYLILKSKKNINFNKQNFLIDRLIIDYIKDNNENTSLIYKKLISKNLFINNLYNKFLFKNKIENIKDFFLKKINNTHYVNSIPFCLKIKNNRVIGKINNINETGLLKFKLKNLNMKDGLLFWIEHIIYCLITKPGNSKLIGIKNSWNFQHLSKEQALNYLNLILKGFKKGKKKPLFLLPETGLSFLRDFIKNKKNLINFKKNIKEIDKLKLIYFFKKYEHIDPYINKIINNLNDKKIFKIIKCINLYLLPPFRENLLFNIK